MKLKEVYGYIRVSTKKQGEGVSLEAQKDAILLYAKQHNLKVVKWFEEKKTAAKRNRTAFNRMISLLHENKADGFIAHKIDRISRNMFDWAKVIEIYDKGLGVYCAHESLNLSERGGFLSANIQAVIAADFINNLRHEAKKGIYKRLDNGIYPFAAPVGYLNAGKGKPKEVDPAKAPLVKLIFELYTKEGYTIMKLIKKMNERGLTNNYGNKMSKNSMQSILHNPFYAGVMRVRGNNYQGTHKPLIPLSTWKKAQDILSGKANARERIHKYLFRRMIRCRSCNYSLIGEKQKGRVYYRCQTKGCPTTTLREDMIEQYITSFLKRLKLHELEHDTLTVLLSQTEQDWMHNQQKLINTFNIKRGALDEKQRKLRSLLLSETLTKEEYLEEKQKVTHEIVQLDEQKTEVSSEKMKILKKFEYFLELAKSPMKLYDLANIEEKRELLEILTSNLQAEGKRLVISTHSPFSELLNEEMCKVGASTSPTKRTMSYTFYPMTSPILLGKRSATELKSLFSHLLEVIPSLPDFNHLLNHEISTNNTSTKRNT